MNNTAQLPGDGTFAVAVAGAVSCQPELADICKNDLQAREGEEVVAILIPEATNPYSPEAVRVQIHGQPVGYLARADARALRALLGGEVPDGTRYQCRAKIQRSHQPGQGGHGQWSVWLDLCPPQ